MKFIDSRIILFIILFASSLQCFGYNGIKLQATRCSLTCLSSTQKGDHHDLLPLSAQSSFKSAAFRASLRASTIGVNLLFNRPSYARKGAFEMDAEIYIRNLLGLRQSSESVFKSLGSFGSPRALDKPFVSTIIELVYAELSKIANVPISTLKKAVEDKTPYYTKYFMTFAPITQQDVSDQYYFDMLLYLIYLESTTYLKSSEARVAFRERIGSAILQWLVSSSLIIPASSKKSSVGLALGIRQLLSTYKNKGLIADFIFDDEDLIDEEAVRQSLSSQMSQSFQITLVRPATILGVLQQAQANSLYHPEITATVIQAMARSAGFELKFDDYLMDNYYREDNFDVQAQDILLECILSSPK